jgi:predicted transcriptional regulator
MTSDEPGVFRPQLSIDRDFTIIPNAWIRNSHLSPGANYLLIYLMTHEVGYEITFGQMQRETGLGIKGVRVALAELQKKSWLVMERTQRNNGQLGPYRYTLLEATVPQSTVVASTVAQGTDNKKNNNEENKVRETYAQIDELFNEFWNAYPRKLDKAKAFRAFKSALKRATFEDILAGVIAYRGDPKRDPEFTKYPATWLNSDSWENAATASLDTEAADRARLRREKEKAASDSYLAEIREQANTATAPVKCKHDLSLARCVPCAKELG